MTIGTSQAAYFNPSQQTVTLHQTAVSHEAPPPSYNEVIAMPTSYPKVQSDNIFTVSAVNPGVTPADYNQRYAPAGQMQVSAPYPAPIQGTAPFPPPVQGAAPFPSPVQGAAPFPLSTQGAVPFPPATQGSAPPYSAVPQHYPPPNQVTSPYPAPNQGDTTMTNHQPPSYPAAVETPEPY